MASALPGADGPGIRLESEALQVVVSPRGAEVQSIRERTSGFEYLWQNGTGVWKGPSPLLFPVIGGLRDKAFCLEGRKYTVPFHGFARGEEFSLRIASPAEAVLVLENSPGTEQGYPFPFRLEVAYRLDGRTLSVRARVDNPGHKTLPASIGFHPGFNVAIPSDGGRPGARLEVTSAKPLVRLLKDPDSGLLGGGRQLWSDGTRLLSLTPDVPGPDAIVLEAHAPVRAVLVDDVTGHRVTLESDCTHFGIWRKPQPEAQFLCLEPWWGTTDPAAPYDDIRAKPNIQLIAPGASFEAGFRLVLE